MDETEWLAEPFEEQRPRLRAVAYRMLGTLAEADDAVQDAWLRLSQADAEAIDNLGGWLTTVVARECLHMLRSRRHRREDTVAAHLPDPVVIPDGDLDPEQEA
jgi:DNA-directed RNA polymerase specialized sigma24 family protein